MALLDYAEYNNAKRYIDLAVNKATVATTVVAGRTYSRWTHAPFAGSEPTTAVACDNTTVGALQGSAGLAGISTWIKRIRASQAAGGTVIFYDRLSHQGGLLADSVAVQTTNLPTAALTRYTSGVGVMASLEVGATAIGATATTFTCSYTNSLGVSGRTSPPCTVGGTSNMNSAALWINIPLQVGDVGVRSVENVTLAASTGTAQEFGVVLWRPLLAVPVYRACMDFDFDAVKHLGALFEQVQPGACIAMLFHLSTAGTQPTAGSLDLIKA